MEVITVSSSEDDPDDPGVEVPVLPAADVSEDDPDDPGVCIPAQSDANIADKYI